MRQIKVDKLYRFLFIFSVWALTTNAQTYKIVDTGQEKYFDNSSEISAPQEGEAFFGQDAQYSNYQPSFKDNGDNTITDNVTGLMWQKGFTESEFDEAAGIADTTTTGEYTDWRVPTTKELYSLINFTGNQGTGDPSASIPPDDASPFIDTNYFEFEYPSVGRYIDAQYLASTEYVGTVMNGEDAFFGVNFADGRIKGYPQSGGDDWYLRLVRGTTTYGQNDFVDNENGTVTDNATELMWMQDDSGDDQFTNLLSGFTNNDGSLNWEEALEFAENMEYAGYSDWRLPNAKELHTIVDYTRAPDVTNSPAIASIFNSSGIINEAGNDDYPFYWTSTTFESGLDAVIIQFGRSLGYYDVGEGDGDQFYDVHGAGAQRTDPKTGESSYGSGPQGDVRRVYNYVRPVRYVNDPTGIENEQSDASEIPSEFELQQNYPNPFNPSTQIVISVPESGNYTLEVYNIMGQEVASLLSNPISAGTHTFNFDASNLTSGIYFYNFSGNNFNQTKKMLLMK